MSEYTTFQVGGCADLFFEPRTEQEFLSAWSYIKQEKLPCFLLGGGANIVVSDKGIRGAVVSLRNWQEFSLSERGVCRVSAGYEISRLAEETAECGWAGLHAFAGMPGTVGGAVWMNARCYGREISDLLETVSYIEDSDEILTISMDRNQWKYKISPFQNRRGIILHAEFSLEQGDSAQLSTEAAEIVNDRRDKGHFRAPCAGSAFKNNRDFGKPSGQIIDECGLKGFSCGGAAVSHWHGNIIINENNASAADIRTLVEAVQEKVENKTGFLLEPEILFIGDWS